MKRSRFLIALSLLLFPAAAQAKDDVVSVISYELIPFQEAWKSFQSVFQAPVETVHLAKEALHIRGEPRVIVAFGGKAALEKYPGSSALIYCMAPGTILRPADRQGSLTQISMMPQPSVAVDKILLIQPTLKRLTVLWISPASESFINALRRAGHARGVDVQSERLGKAEDLPERLRQAQNKTDALWIPPDPPLITEQNLVLLSQFSASSHIPYYTSIDGLAEKGAVASIASSYAEIGRTAAVITQSALRGDTLALEVYPEKANTTLNLTAAAKAGLTIDPAQLAQFQKVIP